MPNYRVDIVPKAEKEFLKLPETVQRSLAKKLLSLEIDPRPSGSKKLKETDYYRIRAGAYRVICAISDADKAVKVLSIGHRRDIYR